MQSGAYCYEISIKKFISVHFKNDLVIHLKEALPRDFELMERVSELAGRNLDKKSRS